jgi:hypothetical protein
MAYRFNLLFHIGEISTVRDSPWSILKEVRTAKRKGGALRECEFDHLYLFWELVCSLSVLPQNQCSVCLCPRLLFLVQNVCGYLKKYILTSYSHPALWQAKWLPRCYDELTTFPVREKDHAITYSLVKDGCAVGCTRICNISCSANIYYFALALNGTHTHLLIQL